MYYKTQDEPLNNYKPAPMPSSKNYNASTEVCSATKRNSSSGLHSRVSLPEVLIHLAARMAALQGVSAASMAVYGMFHAPATLYAVSADYTEATERCPMAQSLPFSRPVRFRTPET